MGDLTRNISRHEIACKCGCGFDTIDFETVSLVQKAVFDFEKTYNQRMFIKISSGCRCEKYNKKVGGAKDSQHLYGRAIDFYLYYLIPNNKIIIEPKLVADYFSYFYPKIYGIGSYKTFTHFDTKSGYSRRWEE